MGRAVKRPSLTTWILIGLVAGVVFGTVWPGPAKQLGVLGAIFLRLIKSIIAPLLFATLVSGIASTGSIKVIGRIGGKALVYFEVLTTVALFVGLAAVNLVKPGPGVALPREAAAGATITGPELSEILEHTFPTSIVDAMARGEVLQIVVFSLLFGMACATIGARARPVLELCDLFGAIGSTVGEHGLRVLLSLGKLVATLWAAEAFFMLVVRGAVRIPLRRFVQAAREPFLSAFSTASSEAALPKALENLQRLGVAETHRGICVAGGVQLQFGWVDVVSGADFDFCGAGGGNSSAVGHADSDDADVDAD
jgi:proton glutamate symport protein